MQCHFEEKEYEFPLNHELLGDDPRIWSPGQVFEKHFGAEAALAVQNPLFWALIGYPYALPGVVLDNFRYGYIWRRRGRKRALPTFAVNLLLQIKRPIYLGRANRRIHMHSAYYRFETTSHQQKALERLAQKLGHRALVMYASPVFHTHKNLYKYTATRQLVTNSNFVRAQKLSGHSNWNYESPGCLGIATSEPEFIEDLSFDEQLDGLCAEALELDSEWYGLPVPDLSFLNTAATETCREESKTRNPIAREFLRRCKRLQPDKRDSVVSRSFQLFARVSIFSDLFGLAWWVVSPQDD